VFTQFVQGMTVSLVTMEALDQIQQVKAEGASEEQVQAMAQAAGMIAAVVGLLGPLMAGVADGNGVRDTHPGCGVGGGGGKGACGVGLSTGTWCDLGRTVAGSVRRLIDRTWPSLSCHNCQEGIPDGEERLDESAMRVLCGRTVASRSRSSFTSWRMAARRPCSVSSTGGGYVLPESGPCPVSMQLMVIPGKGFVQGVP
jgi:hypothetical protein